MVDSVLSFSRSGLRDWLFQRVSALIIAAYSLCLSGFYLTHPNLTFKEWSLFLAQPTMSVFGLLMLVSLLIHAWIGIWTVLTDYVRCPIVRLSLEVFVVLLSIAYLAWGIDIFWRL